MSAHDEVAEWYDTWVGTGSVRDDPFFPAVEALSCFRWHRLSPGADGHHRPCSDAPRGHRVVLADLSPELVSIAMRRVAEENVESRVEEIVVADARDLSRWGAESFDAV